MKKRLYLNSCSFMDSNGIVKSPSLCSEIFEDIPISHIASLGGSSNELIFKKTLIDIINNHFEFVIICWSHPERFYIIELSDELDYDKLKKDSDTNLQKLPYFYKNCIPGHGDTMPYDLLKFEPKGTDDTILYTISLHNLLNNKNIPHLFLNMGKLDSNVLEARYNWIKHINPNNYLSINDSDSILDKMKFSFVEYFVNLGGTQFLKDREIALTNKNNNIDNISRLLNTNPYLIDLGGHLSDKAFTIIYEIIHNHIKKHLI